MAESSGTESIFAAATFLLFGAATIKLLAFTRVPYSVLLLLWGLAIGLGQSTCTKNWHRLEAGFALWQGLDPGFLFLLLAPPVLFHAAGSLPKARLSHSACHIILLGIVGVGTGAAMTAVIMRYMFPYGWSWPQSFLFGAIVAATDPVAAVSLLKQVHASEELTTVIDGEALVDDGVAAVLYAIFLKSVQGSPESASGCSNILATVTLGMSMALFGWSMLHKDLQDPVTVCWEVIEYFANTLIFVISGVIIAGRIYAGHQAGSPHILTGIDYAWAVALWLLLLVVRVINIILFWPILARTGPGLDLPSAAATAWSGIRGFVGLILALMVSVDTDIQDEPYKLLCLFFMATTACLTIILQGGIFELVLWGLGLVKPALPETNVQQGQQTSSLAAATA
ncbi:hypothetical protein WJX79_001024 [Trebouxia sp. C0005]